MKYAATTEKVWCPTPISHFMFVYLGVKVVNEVLGGPVKSNKHTL